MKNKLFIALLFIMIVVVGCSESNFVEIDYEYKVKEYYGFGEPPLEREMNIYGTVKNPHSIDINNVKLCARAILVDNILDEDIEFIGSVPAGMTKSFQHKLSVTDPFIDENNSLSSVIDIVVEKC